MAKKADPDLIERMRAAGLRRKFAETLADASDRTPDMVKARVKDLTSLIEELEDRATGGPARRSEAAKKAARTRKRKAAERSAAARRGAKTRASS